MENKKFLIPIILGIALLCGIVFTLVYKKTSEDPFKEPEIQTLAPKETKAIETKVSTEHNGVEDFEVNEAKSLDEISDGKVFIYNSELEEALDIQENTDNGIEGNDVTENSETLSDEEINKIIQEQVESQTARPYNSQYDTEEYNDEELESIAAETDSDLSKYEMDTSYLDDPEKVQEILKQMGY